MSKRKNRKVIEKTTAIDMGKYVNSDPIVDQCIGCNKTFEHECPDGVVFTTKCLAYANPKAKWNDAPVLMEEVLIKSKKHPKGLLEMLPVVDTSCPLATHVTLRDRGEAQHKRVGQQHQNKG